MDRIDPLRPQSAWPLCTIAGLPQWRRALDPSLAEWLAGLPPHRLPRMRAAGKVGDVTRWLAEAFLAAGTPAAPMRLAFARDVQGLAEGFAALIAHDRVAMRLEVIADDGCRLFHCDRTALRLLTSYRGPGPQWLAPADAALGLSGRPVPKERVQQLPTAAVALLPGSESPEGMGIVHRSPPIAGSGVVRLLLVIEPG